MADLHPRDCAVNKDARFRMVADRDALREFPVTEPALSIPQLEWELAWCWEEIAQLTSAIKIKTNALKYGLSVR